MKYILLIIVLLLSSCSESYLVKYTMQGTATTADITYYDNGNNVEESVTLPWSKEIFVRDGDLVGISAHNTSAGEMDCIIFFYGHGNIQTFERQKDEIYILIKGVIHSIL
jgi:hypothetical protein